jgi:hypothetical protein
MSFWFALRFSSNAIAVVASADELSNAAGMASCHAAGLK